MEMVAHDRVKLFSSLPKIQKRKGDMGLYLAVHPTPLPSLPQFSLLPQGRIDARREWCTVHRTDLAMTINGNVEAGALFLCVTWKCQL